MLSYAHSTSIIPLFLFLFPSHVVYVLLSWSPCIFIAVLSVRALKGTVRVCVCVCVSSVFLDFSLLMICSHP